MSEVVRHRTVAALCLTELVALGSLAIPLTVGLALTIPRLDTALTPEAALSVVVGCGAVTAMIANPVFGWLSDRSRQPHRVRWILGGVLAGAAMMPLVTVVDSILGLTLVWCLLQAAYNATFASLYGTIADVVPEADRARVSGLFSASAGGAMVVALGLIAILPKSAWVMFAMMPAVSVPVALLAAWHLRTVAPLARGGGGAGGSGRGWLRSVPRQYWWVWSQRLLTQLAHAIVLMFGVFYLIRRAGLDEDRAATWVAATAALAALLGMVAAVVAGRAAGRSGNYGPYLLVGIGLILAALVIKAVATAAIVYHVATLLVGLGIGIYYAVDLALVLRTIPAGRAGTLLGFFNIARTLPQSLAPAIAPLLLGIGGGDLVGADRTQNYFALYAFGCVVAVVALLLLIPITVLKRGDRAPVERGPHAGAPGD